VPSKVTGNVCTRVQSLNVKHIQLSSCNASSSFCLKSDSLKFVKISEFRFVPRLPPRKQTLWKFSLQRLSWNFFVRGCFNISELTLNWIAKRFCRKFLLWNFDNEKNIGGANWICYQVVYSRNAERLKPLLGVLKKFCVGSLNINLFSVVTKWKLCYEPKCCQ
jgi:hypothetical protein